MMRLALRTFFDRWPLFIGTTLAVTVGVAIVHAGMTIILATEHAKLPDGLTSQQAEAFRQAASGANTLTGMTVILGVFLTMFVVSSTFNFAIDQRRSDLAVLRLSGITTRQIRWLVLVEALLVACFGTVAGMLLGFVFAQTQRVILIHLGTFPAGLSMPVRPAVLVLDLIVAGTVCLLGAWSTAQHATRIRALDALRRSESEQRVMTARRWVVASLAVLLTAIQVYFSATTGGMLIPLLLGLGIVITASVAMSHFSPLLVPMVAGGLTLFTRHSPVTDLAVSNLRDALRRTVSIAAPMIVLVSLVMGLQGILDTQTKAGATETIRLIRADLIATGEKINLAAVQVIDGVALAAPETIVPLTVHLTHDGDTTDEPGTVVAVDPAAFRVTHLQLPARGDVATFGPDSIVFGPGLDHMTQRDTYDRITLRIQGRTVSVREAARMDETLAGVDGFYIDRSILPVAMLNRTTTVLLQLKPDADTAAVKQALMAAGATSIQTPREVSQAENNVKNAENRGVMIAIVGLGSLYALISLLSTIAIAIGQRKTEFATLRLTGVIQRQIQRATIVEALTASSIGLMLGAVAALLSLIGLWAATNRIYGSPVIAVPWGLLASIVLVTSVLTIVTTLIATQAVMRTPALRSFEHQE